MVSHALGLDMPNENPDRLFSEPSEFPNQHVEQTGSMSLGAMPNSNGDEVSPVNGDRESTAIAAPPATQQDQTPKAVHDVTNSEIGVATLLNRLKQSIASAKEFATFLKRRSTIEEEHSKGLKKLCQITADSIRRPEQRHGSFLQAYEEITNIHERMADNGAHFALSLHQMHEDLLEMVANIDRGRKHWKTNGLANEQRVADTEAAMRKSKSKYEQLADEYERARTGERQGGKLFGIKGPKSAAQHEEDLLRKLQAADSHYASQVQATQAQRGELFSRLRPEAVKALEELIKECDSAVTMQMQKFASFNEKLLLSNGLNISPLKGAEAGHQPRSLREVVRSIDNNRDLNNYIASFEGKIPQKVAEIKYQRAAVLNQPPPPAAVAQRTSDPHSSWNSRQGPQGPPQGPAAPPQGPPPGQFQGQPQGPPPNFGPDARRDSYGVGGLPHSHTNPALASYGAVQSPQHSSHMSQQFNQGPPALAQRHDRSFSQGQPLGQYGSPAPPMGMGGQNRGSGGAPGQNFNSVVSNGPPQLSSLPFQTSRTESPPPSFPPQSQSPTYSTSPPMPRGNNLPPVRPCFGVDLNTLFERDGSAVPLVVVQCIQAVDTFGLEVEGIYRLSGTASHVTSLKAAFDNDPTRVDFRDPANFMHDVNSCAGLLKQFFRELPDPLLTKQHYTEFVEAAKNDDDIIRRDSLHAIINGLPDPNYATLRLLTLHLSRVMKNANLNRMNSSNLAIVFGPTLMGSSTGPAIQDAGYQVRVVATILDNALQIFDED